MGINLKATGEKGKMMSKKSFQQQIKDVVEETRHFPLAQGMYLYGSKPGPFPYATENGQAPEWSFCRFNHVPAEDLETILEDQCRNPWFSPLVIEVQLLADAKWDKANGEKISQILLSAARRMNAAVVINDHGVFHSGTPVMDLTIWGDKSGIAHEIEMPKIFARIGDETFTSLA